MSLVLSGRWVLNCVENLNIGPTSAVFRLLQLGFLNGLPHKSRSGFITQTFVTTSSSVDCIPIHTTVVSQLTFLTQLTFPNTFNCSINEQTNLRITVRGCLINDDTMAHGRGVALEKTVQESAAQCRFVIFTTRVFLQHIWCNCAKNMFHSCSIPYATSCSVPRCVLSSIFKCVIDDLHRIRSKFCIPSVIK